MTDLWNYYSGLPLFLKLCYGVQIALLPVLAYLLVMVCIAHHDYNVAYRRFMDAKNAKDCLRRNR